MVAHGVGEATDQPAAVADEPALRLGNEAEPARVRPELPGAEPGGAQVGCDGEHLLLGSLPKLGRPGLLADEGEDRKPFS